MVELGISTFGETRSLRELDRLTVMPNAFVSWWRRLSWLTRLVWMCMGLVSTIERICGISPRDYLGSWGSQYQENSFDQCGQHSLKYGSDSFVPTICHYRCFVKWTSGDYGWKGFFHGIFSLVWI